MKGEIYYMISEIVQGAEQIETCDCKDCRKYDDFNKEIGNYFKTKKDAQLAIKKLKAWKRLKDKGFEFEWVDKDTGSIKFVFFNREGKITKEMWQDIDLLFGGEE